MRRENIDKVAQLKDLPMGLPEGTVRAVLALIVAVVGLPLLLFSSQLGTTPEIAGYLNGIITGVFGYYFGTRAAASTATTNNNSVASAQQAAQEQTRQAERAQNDADQKMQLAEKIQSTADVDPLLDKAQRQLALAKALLAMLPQTNSLPTGLGDVLPGDLNNTITRAESIINALRNLSKERCHARSTRRTQSSRQYPDRRHFTIECPFKQSGTLSGTGHAGIRPHRGDRDAAGCRR